MTTSSRPDSPSDRLGEIGVADTSRILPLIEEIRKRIPWTDSDWEVLFEGARAAPDPNLYFLNVSKLCDSLPADDLVQAFARRGNIRVLGALLGGSESLPGQIANRPEIFAFLFLEGGHGRPGGPASLLAEAEEAADRSGTEEEIKAALRRQKLREVARIAARDLAGVAPLPEVMQDLSALASAALAGAVRFSRRHLSERFGAPVIETIGGGRRECGFVVLGMGKLGGNELNFSSDIDLVYLYETERGMTEGGEGKEPVTLHQYFVKLCEIVTRILSEVTEDGFVFRVDLRLRPDGTKGELANSLRSAEIYYESWGQTWERAAMIKARPVAGDAWVGEGFLRTITPFVFRKYLDFTSIEEIKEMKERVDLAAARARKHERDLKLGVGGIREIEFFVQAHQLIYGGKNPDLRRRGTVETLRALVGAGIVSPGEGETLTEAYGFLRSLEHRIQVYQDRQTHALPQRAEDLLRLARTMGLPDGAALVAGMDRHTGNVRAIYHRLFRAAPGEAGPEISPKVLAVLDAESEEEMADRLAALGFADREAALRNVAMLRDGPPFVRMPARARRYLGKIAPLILDRVIRSPDPDLALHHTERFLSAVGARTMFYALLFENRKVIDVLVRLFGSSRFLSGYLLRHPELLDTFLRKDLSPLVKAKSQLRKELGEALAACADFEQELDEMRRFKNMETLRVGMNDLAGNLSLEEGLFQLSALAEALLSYGLVLARRETRRRFGVPMVEGEGGESAEAEFCVMGMGKLGAEELSYHSDLDIIFLYSRAGETVPAPGQAPADFRKVSNHEYFAKVAQRLISILTTVTREGYVYHLDTRLRPSGNAGPLVSSLAAFERYHERSAQLWERQALLKCRFVAGDRDLGRRVEETIARFIFDRPLPPDPPAEIHRLRKRMELELGKERQDRLNLKVGRGGIVDVEFAVQYLQLVHGPGNRSLRVRSTLKALYELLRANVLSEDDFRVMDEGYRFLRSLEVSLRLSYDASIEQFDPSRLPPDQRDRYHRKTEAIRTIYLNLLGLRE
ncbi:MAG TPA: bifunctional [glutamate--ammonia ligase]-adenylyl-L-tyrosine phosphorylase/[glutamate--ammonia-ligase] adenylyltransferase [Candidatus Deferrimicrobiaceae bacterium]|nr:bifunctional [glutamate--ammonia ligase]-adenylyl-L-tyrosine phosphorylase/[glutamate--ammonia-ligase] adenylyltransferase [Candidatus Deferrimicrobiaceae bacterium]